MLIQRVYELVKVTLKPSTTLTVRFYETGSTCRSNTKSNVIVFDMDNSSW